MDLNDFFRLLGLMPGASMDQIKSAYKKVAKQTHPDTGGSKEAFIEVNHAYKMLTDPSYRRDSEHVKRSREQQDLELRMNIAVSFEDAFFGRNLVINFNRPNKNKKAPTEILELEIEIRPGSVASREMCVKEYGCRSGAQLGDAKIFIHFEEHPMFKVRGLDVAAEHPIPLKLMLKGGRSEVETMYGVVEIRIPAGSCPGDSVLVPGHGVNRQGQHIAVLSLVYPKKQEFKDDDFWKKIDLNF